MAQVASHLDSDPMLGWIHWIQYLFILFSLPESDNLACVRWSLKEDTVALHEGKYTNILGACNVATPFLQISQRYHKGVWRLPHTWLGLRSWNCSHLFHTELMWTLAMNQASIPIPKGDRNRWRFWTWKWGPGLLLQGLCWQECRKEWSAVELICAFPLSCLYPS